MDIYTIFFHLQMREALREIASAGCEGMNCDKHDNPCHPCIARRGLEKINTTAPCKKQ